MWQSALAALLALHGLIHVMGFAGTWRIGGFKAVAATPSYPDGLIPGAAPVLVLGVAWALLAAGFVTAPVGFLAGARWWLPVTAATAILSLVLCAAWWNEAYAGALIDAAIIVLLAGMALWARPSWA